MAIFFLIIKYFIWYLINKYTFILNFVKCIPQRPLVLRMSLVFTLGTSFYFYSYNVGLPIRNYISSGDVRFFLSNKIEMRVNVEYVWIDGL